MRKKIQKIMQKKRTRYPHGAVKLKFRILNILSKSQSLAGRSLYMPKHLFYWAEVKVSHKVK